MVSTLLEADVGPFEVLNMSLVPEFFLKSKVTLKVYFYQTVAMAIMKVYFYRVKYDYGQCMQVPCSFPFVNQLHYMMRITGSPSFEFVIENRFLLTYSIGDT